MERGGFITGEGVEVSDLDLVFEELQQHQGGEFHQEVLDSPKSLLVVFWVAFGGNNNISIASQIHHQFNQLHKVCLMLLVLLEHDPFSVGAFDSPLLFECFHFPIEIVLDVGGEVSHKEEDWLETVLVDPLQGIPELVPLLVPFVLLHLELGKCEFDSLDTLTRQSTQVVQNGVPSTTLELQIQTILQEKSQSAHVLSLNAEANSCLFVFILDIDARPFGFQFGYQLPLQFLILFLENPLVLPAPSPSLSVSVLHILTLFDGAQDVEKPGAMDIDIFHLVMLVNQQIHDLHGLRSVSDLGHVQETHVVIWEPIIHHPFLPLQ